VVATSNRNPPLAFTPSCELLILNKSIPWVLRRNGAANRLMPLLSSACVARSKNALASSIERDPGCAPVFRLAGPLTVPICKLNLKRLAVVYAPVNDLKAQGLVADLRESVVNPCI
jgi:hypothetical protein